MPTRTGKQTGLLVLGIMKLIGGIGVFIIGVILGLVYGETLLSATGTASDVSALLFGLPLGLFFVAGGISMAVYGLGGVVHGVLDIRGSRPGSSATAAGIFGIFACLGNLYSLFSQIRSANVESGENILTFLLVFVMFVLNIARTFLAFSTSAETKANMLAMVGMGGYPQYGTPNPFASTPQPGGYGQPTQPQTGGYGQPVQPQSGMTPPGGYNGQNGGYGGYGGY